MTLVHQPYGEAAPVMPAQALPELVYPTSIHFVAGGDVQVEAPQGTAPLVHEDRPRPGSDPLMLGSLLRAHLKTVGTQVRGVDNDALREFMFAVERTGGIAIPEGKA